MYSLYSLRIDKNYTAYAWIDPSGVCFTSRERAPYGFQVSPAGFLDGMTIEDLKTHGFKKASTRLTQDELARGILL